MYRNWIHYWCSPKLKILYIIDASMFIVSVYIFLIFLIYIFFSMFVNLSPSFVRQIESINSWFMVCESSFLLPSELPLKKTPLSYPSLQDYYFIIVFIYILFFSFLGRFVHIYCCSLAHSKFQKQNKLKIYLKTAKNSKWS